MFKKGDIVKVKSDSSFKDGEIATVESGPYGICSGGNYHMTDGRVALGYNMELVAAYPPSTPQLAFGMRPEAMARIEELKQHVYNPNIIKKTMTNIVKFAKDLTLSADEKELRRAGLQDENGNWTDGADDIVKNLIAVEAGFKSIGEMKTKYDATDGLSFIELHTAYTKYADKLLETAKAYNAENKKASS